MSSKEKVNILVVDDQPAKLLTYEVMLRELDESLITATCAREVGVAGSSIRAGPTGSSAAGKRGDQGHL